jgi:hypothetical protein
MYSRAPVSADSVAVVSIIRCLPQPPPRHPKKIRKLKKQMVHKFQNMRHARTGRDMVKFSSPNVSSTDPSGPVWLCSIMNTF